MDLSARYQSVEGIPDEEQDRQYQNGLEDGGKSAYGQHPALPPEELQEENPGADIEKRRLG
jgi:hypothetical protein